VKDAGAEQQSASVFVLSGKKTIGKTQNAIDKQK